MKIQAVLFDMGGTIETFCYTHALRRKATGVLAQCLLQAGIDLHIGEEALFERISQGLQHYKRWSIQSMEELPPLRVWAEFILAGLAYDPVLLQGIAEELMFLVETRFYDRAMRPEIPGVLAAIRDMGLKIGLISNVNSRSQVPFNLRAYGIFDYFNPIVLSSEYGRRKPDPAIFHYAARLMQVPTSACLYVGDRLARDVSGARRAGYGMAVQIKHDFDQGEKDQGAAPDAVIEDMTQLLDILRTRCISQPASQSPGKLRALIFDAGDVLYYRPQRGARFAAFLEEQGMQLSPNHALQKKEIDYKAYRGEINHDEYRAAVVHLYGITQPELVARGKQVLIEDDANLAFFDGVPETLRTLKERGYLLAIITDTANSISAKLSWFERGGFGQVWDAIISSIEIGARKPDPRLYQAALQQLGVSAGEAIFVGHRAVELEGARAVGLRTAAFNYEAAALADVYLDHFQDLLKLVEEEIPEQDVR
jgi:putative hydrolase of the HAD superfamily